MSNERHDVSRGQTAFERYVMHVVQAISIAAILGLAGILWDMRNVMADQSTAQAVTNAQLLQMNERITDFRTFVSGFYTEAQAQRDIQPMRDDIADHEDRIRALEAASRLR